MDLEIITLSKVSQKGKDKHHVISLTQSKYNYHLHVELKYNTNGHIYETDSQTKRTELWLPGGRRSNGSLGLADANYYM